MIKIATIIASVTLAAASAHAERVPYGTFFSQQPFGEVVLSTQQGMCHRNTRLMFIKTPGKRTTTGCYYVEGDTVFLRWPAIEYVRPDGAPDTMSVSEFKFDSGGKQILNPPLLK